MTITPEEISRGYDDYIIMSAPYTVKEASKLKSEIDVFNDAAKKVLFNSSQLDKAVVLRLMRAALDDLQEAVNETNNHLSDNELDDYIGLVGELYDGHYDYNSFMHDVHSDFIYPIIEGIKISEGGE